MELKTFQDYDRIRLNSPRGLIVEFQPDGDNAMSGSPVIEFVVGFIYLPKGQIALTLQLPAESTYKSGSAFVLLNDVIGSDKLVINGVEFEKVAK